MITTIFNVRMIASCDNGSDNENSPESQVCEV